MIRKLPPELVREIAAGEVISSPVDVVKELLENALDAGASRLELQLLDGGITRIELKDNGKGITKEELLLAVEAHSTSKLESIDNISTLGFRGEGLHAIRYAARISLTSRPAKQLGGATLIAQQDNLDLQENPAPAGTTAIVTQLFNYLPARLSTLETPASETKKIINLLSRYLLHHPYLNFKLSTDEEQRWSYAGGSFTEGVKFIWGGVTANRLLDLDAEQGAYKLTGLLSRPELSRARRDRLFLAVNGRPVEWTDELLKAILTAYKELLPTNLYPVGIINLVVPPNEVLVNTSPDKSRVRFLARQEVVHFVETAIKQLLSTHPLARALPELHNAEVISQAPNHSFPELKHIGTYRELYLLAEAEGQLWMVDQHAAHERILYEELQKRYQVEEPVTLEAPELINLTPEEIASYNERNEKLSEFGLKLEPFGKDTFRLSAIPALLAGHPALITDVIKGTLGQSSVEEAWRKVLARLACLPAIRAGHHLSEATAQALLDALGQCEIPWSCPHGRPTALVLSELEVARRFGRRGIRSTLAPWYTK